MSAVQNRPMVSSYNYQAPMPQQYFYQPSMQMMQQPLYVSEPVRHGAQPMIVQPVVMAPSPYHPQMAYNMSSAPAPQPSPVYVYPPMVMNAPQPQPMAMQCSQMEFTVEETTGWFTELCMMRGWNADVEAYKGIFVRHQICGTKMKALNYEDLTVLGIKKEHRLAVLEAIEQAFEEQSVYYSQTKNHGCSSDGGSMLDTMSVSDSNSPSTDSEMAMSSEEELSWSRRSAYAQQPEPARMPCSSSGSGFGRTRVESPFGRSMQMDMCPSENSGSECAAVAPVAPKKKKLMPRPKNPMQYHVLMTLKMKTGRSLQSTYIGHVTKDTVVWVNTVRGRRARIVEKTETGTKNLGWVSLRLEDGKPLLVQEQEYLSNPSLYPIRETESGCPIDGA